MPSFKQIQCSHPDYYRNRPQPLQSLHQNPGFSTTVSNQLLQDSAFSIDSFLSEVIGTAWSNTASEAIINGNASNFKSLLSAAVGFTAPVGVTAQLSYDSLVSFYSALDPSYLAGSALWMNSRTWAKLLQVKDWQLRPILSVAPGITGKPFSTLFGLEIRIAQAIPDLGISKPVILLGDASASYTYRQAGPLLIRRAEELRIAQNPTQFFAFQRAGGYSTGRSENKAGSLHVLTIDLAEPG